MPFLVWVAQVLVSEETAEKLRSKHHLEPTEVIDAIQCQPALLGRRTHDERGTRVMVQVRIRRKRVLVVLHSAGAEPHPEPATGWRAYRRWTIPQIQSARAPLRPVVTGLIGTLQRHGLAVQNDNIAEAIENYTKANVDDIQRRTHRGGAGQPTVPAAPRKLSRIDLAFVTPQPSWSPTELGERVLGYYYLAATELGADLASTLGDG